MFKLTLTILKSSENDRDLFPIIFCQLKTCFPPSCENKSRFLHLNDSRFVRLLFQCVYVCLLSETVDLSKNILYFNSSRSQVNMFLFFFLFSKHLSIKSENVTGS